MKIKAIDISYAQHDVDFEKVKKSGIKTVIIRNGYLGKTDTGFKKHIEGAIQAGLDIGTYTYIMSDTVAQARTEARETVERLKPYKGHLTLPVFCDMESEKYYGEKFDSRLRTDVIKTFCSEIEKAGYYVALYINPAWLEQYTYKKELLDKYDIWLAAWTDDANKPTKYDYGQVMWQWGVCNVNGVRGVVDGNLVYIDYPSKIRESGKNFIPAGKVVKRTAHDIVKSYGQAAVRSCYQKNDDNVIRRCVKNKLYPVDANITVNGVKWLKHADEIGYSMLQDGLFLFQKVGTYIEYVTKVKINVRSSAKLAPGNILGQLDAGAKVYVTGTAENGWMPCVYDGQAAYVSAQYVKEV